MSTADAAPPDDRPFVGLAPFAEDQAGYFFGRDLDRAILASNLIAARLLVLYGPSGCGKSSLIDAGVAHQINRVQAPRDLAARGVPEFAVVSFRNWRDAPARGLLAAVRSVVERVLGRPIEPPAADLPLADALGHFATTLGGTLLLALDQFEDYFLYHGRSAAAGTFAHDLAEVVNRPGLRVNVLLAIREDALAQLDAFEGTLPNLLSNTLRLDPLDRDRGREAIVRPIERYNDRHGESGRVEIEPGLVGAVLARVEAGAITLETTGRGRLDRPADADAADRPIESAYLQLVMDRLWSESIGPADRTLRLATYHRLGAAEGIVRRHLDTVLARLGRRDRRRAERLLTYLVTPSRSKIALEPAYLAEKTGDDPGRVAAVLNRLNQPDCRVVRKVDDPARENDRFEVYHDVLARVIVDDYAPRVRRRRVRTWVAGAAVTLAVAAGLIAVAAIQWRYARVQTVKVGQQKIELGKLTEAAKDARTRADLALSRAEEHRQQARKQQELATSRQLASLAVSEKDQHLARALLLAAEAARRADTFEARSSLFQTLQARPCLLSFLEAAEGLVFSVAFSPDGRTLAAGVGGAAGGGVVLWDVASCRRLGEPLAVAEGLVLCIAFSPDGRALAAGYVGGGGGGVVLWEASSRRRLGEPLAVAEGDVRGVAFSPDGRALAAGYDLAGGGGGVVLWEASSRRRLGEPLAVAEGLVLCIAFSPDGRALAAGYAGGGVVLWDVASRRRLGEPLAVAERNVPGVAFSPDGRTLAAGYVDVDVAGGGGGVALWDVASRRRLGEPLAVAEGLGFGVAFSPDGRTLAAGVGGGGVALWDVASRRRLGEPLAVAEGDVRGVAFSPDGRTLAAGVGGGGVVLWDVASRRRLGEPLAVAEGGVLSVAFSPDGRALAAGYVGGGGGGVALWDVASRRRLGEPLAVAEGDVRTVVFSPDGRTLAAGYDVSGGFSVVSGGVALWDVASRRRLGEPLAVAEGDVRTVVFSPDGRTLVIAKTDELIEKPFFPMTSARETACRIANRNLSLAEWREALGPDEPYRRTCPDLPDGAGVGESKPAGAAPP